MTPHQIAFWIARNITRHGNEPGAFHRELAHGRRVHPDTDGGTWETVDKLVWEMLPDEYRPGNLLEVTHTTP